MLWKIWSVWRELRKWRKRRFEKLHGGVGGAGGLRERSGKCRWRVELFEASKRRSQGRRPGTGRPLDRSLRCELRHKVAELNDVSEKEHLEQTSAALNDAGEFGTSTTLLAARWIISDLLTVLTPLWLIKHVLSHWRRSVRTKLRCSLFLAAFQINLSYF